MVMMDYKGPERKVRPFYCVRCGKCVCEITGQAEVLIPGYPDDEDIKANGVRFLAKCKGVIYMGKDNRITCTAKYIFN